MNVPPPYRASDPGSFAQATLATRVPAILLRTLATAELDGASRARLQALHGEVARGDVVAPLPPTEDDAPDRDDWRAVEDALATTSWRDVPFWIGEAFLYRRIEAAVDWRRRRVDPFRPQKQAEERDAPVALARALAAIDDASSTAQRTRALLTGALWGNRVDLSLDTARAHAGATDDDLLVDDRDAVLARLDAATPGATVVVVADNAATELAHDLALVDDLVARGLRVDLLVKDAPFFVSDALIDDVDRLAAVLAAAGGATAALAARVARARDDGRVVVRDHPWTTSARFFADIDDDLRRAFAAAALVIVKGDANYRRLTRDARWDPATPFADVVADVPGSLVALRTLKADVVCGLPRGAAERLDVVEPTWRVSGKRGLIQARL